jgi:hydroxymethylbilane synthase
LTLFIGTRGSQLALAQAQTVRDRIVELIPGDPVELSVLKTQGDAWGLQDPATSLEGIPVGLFTRELDDALLNGSIQAAIHSLKDVPTTLPHGIVYAALIKREDPRDALISRTGQTFAQLPTGSKIGTSSPRREAQIRFARPDLEVVPLRGNVDTRIRKMREGTVDAILLAAAGLKRLGRESEITEILEPDIMVPAPAQGVLVVTARAADHELLEKLRLLNDPDTRVCAMAERAFLKTLLGGCRVPVGALATLKGEVLTLIGVIADPKGNAILRDQVSDLKDNPLALGEKLANEFLENGARQILSDFGRI